MYEKLIAIAIIVGIISCIVSLEMGRSRNYGTRRKGPLTFLIGAGLIVWGLYSAIHSQLS